MDFRRLEAFSKVYEHKSFSKAATELFLSQPTISAHVSALEKDLGVQLFDRLGRVIMPTPAGEVLYRHSKEAFACLEKARVEIEFLQDRVAGELFMGCSTIPGHFLLPQVIARFTMQYPDVKLRMTVGDSMSIVGQVSAGELVLGLVGAKDEQYDLTYSEVLKDDLIIVGARDMVSKDSEHTVEELCRLPWVFREVGSGTRRAVEAGLTKAGVDLRDVNIKVVVDSTQAVLQFVRSGLGVSITSRLAAQPLIDKKELVELSAPSFALSRSFYCVYHERRSFFPAVRYFIEFIEKECARLPLNQQGGQGRARQRSA